MSGRRFTRLENRRKECWVFSPATDLKCHQNLWQTAQLTLPIFESCWLIVSQTSGKEVFFHVLLCHQTNFRTQRVSLLQGSRRLLGKSCDVILISLLSLRKLFTLSQLITSCGSVLDQKRQVILRFFHCEYSLSLLV